MSTAVATPALTAQQVSDFDRDGFLIIRNAITPEQVVTIRQAILDLIPRDLNFPKKYWAINAGRIKPYHDGYGDTETRRGHEDNGIFDGPEYMPLLCNEKVYAAAAQLLGTQELHVEDGTIGVTIRNDFGPTLSQDLHIDASVPEELDNFLFTPEELHVGGCYYLTDVEPGGGGIHVVPGGHKLVEERAKADPRGRHLYDNWVNITDFPDPIEVTAAAGDYILTHSMLPHAGAQNRSGRTRVAYFTRYARMDSPHFTPQMVDGDRFNKLQLRAMTPLGRKLLGVDPWN